MVLEPSLLTGQRQAAILAQLARDGRVLAAQLAATFNVSEDTVRRDLRELAARGACRRVYGGALPPAPDDGTLNQRRERNGDRKAQLAERIVGAIGPGASLFIDAGSTNLMVAERLPAGVGLTVVTNAPAIACVLQDREGILTILLGGRLDPRTGACLGAQTMREAERLRPAILVLGACGVDATAGVTAHHPEEAELKTLLAERADEVWVAATNRKLGAAAPFLVAPTRRIARLVVEHDADEARLDAFRASGVRVERAGAPAGAAPGSASRAA